MNTLFTHQLASSIANDILKYLQPHCTIINIAGSIRREKPEVKDIEIVALPKYQIVKDLFGNVIQHQRDTNFCYAATHIGKILKGKPDGKYMQIEVDVQTQTINLDLFMPTEEDYYRQLAIRTGSADYAHKVIAMGWVKKGWCGSDKGFVRQDECDFYIDIENKTHWKCKAANPTKPPHWKSEAEFFEWLGVPFVEPKLRNV